MGAEDKISIYHPRRSPTLAHSHTHTNSLSTQSIFSPPLLSNPLPPPAPPLPPLSSESRDAVTFGGALVDSVYLNAPEHVELDVGTGAAVAIDASGWKDVVVWNPHLTMKVRRACAACACVFYIFRMGRRMDRPLPRMHPLNPSPSPHHTPDRPHNTQHQNGTQQECYQSFVCVENARAGEPVTVQPGADWRATTNFQVVDL